MKYKYLVESNKIIQGPSDKSITYNPTENQMVKEIEIDENNPPNWTINKDGEFKGFPNKKDIEWDAENNCVIPIKPENKIIRIRNLAREKFIELKNDLDKEEKRKIQLTDIDDWTEADESEFLLVTNEYNQAIIDYNSIKQLLVDNVANLDSVMPQVKETLNKYNINI